MNRISIKGVAIGNLADIASTYLAGIPIGIFMLMRGYPIDRSTLLENGTFFVAVSFWAGCVRYWAATSQHGSPRMTRF